MVSIILKQTSIFPGTYFIPFNMPKTSIHIRLTRLSLGIWIPVLLCWSALLGCKTPLMGQRLVIPPFQGHTTDTSLRVWMMVKGVQELRLSLGGRMQTISTANKVGWKKQVPVEADWHGLSADSVYTLSIWLDGVETACGKAFRTLSKPSNTPEDLSFTLGSCHFIGTGPFRLLRPGHYTRIFKPLEAVKADFNLWLGDNVYLLTNEWNSPSRTYRKYTKVRQNGPTQALLHSKPQYAITDDHDFGPNNSDGAFFNKDMTSKCFADFWPNPDVPDGLKGNVGKFSRGDCDFFLLDGRYHRLASGRVQMYGPEQMDWLRRELQESKATFKFVVGGSQSLSEVNQGETWTDYQEQKDFLEFLRVNRIPGVVFLSGDRHFTEMMRLEQSGMYPLHELTCSPLTSMLRRKPLKKSDPEHINPLRVDGTLLVDHNFGQVKIQGDGPQRSCTFIIHDDRGREVWSRTFLASELQF